MHVAGHIQDRWWRDKKDENGKPVLNARGKPVREKTPLYGKGLRYKVRYPDPEGSGEKSESFPDGKLGRAKDFLAKVQTDVLTGTYIDPDAGKVGLAQYVTNWANGQSEDAHTRQTTLSRLNSQIYPFFGKDCPLDTIGVDRVRKWQAWMKDQGTKASYRSQVFSLLSAILSAAADERKIHVNPCLSKSIKPPKPEQKKVIPWPEQKVRKMQEAIPSRYRIVVPIGAGLGLRQMEILAMSPDDINRDAMEFNVNRQIRWIDSHPVFAPPKGGKSRVVPISEGGLQALDDYMEEYEPIPLTLPWLEPKGNPVTFLLIIKKVNDNGDAWRNPGSRRVDVWNGTRFNDMIWQPAFKAAGLEYRKQIDGMHALRHFCASNWLARGVSIREVSEFFGHHDPGYTLKVYTHLVPSSHQRARMASNVIFLPSGAGDAAGSPEAA
jgi:integrase